MERTALIIGITGGMGGETARALIGAGWRVRALHRAPEVASARFAELRPVEWVQGDALSSAEVVAAAAGVSVIVHAANPPGYKNWQGLQLPMLESSIAAARAAGARLVFPGTIYNFGPDSFPVIDERSSQQPQTRKGAIRVAMEKRLRAAADEGVPVLIVRAGDFFGPRTTGNSWFSAAVVKPGRAVRSVVYPGEPGVGHAWAYLPDLAQTIVQLLERSAELQPFDVFHFAGHWFERGVELAEATCRAAGLSRPKIRRFPWLALHLLAPFSETFREMLEMRYLWKVPVRLDNRKLVGLLGREPHTPIDVALRETLAGLQCLAESERLGHSRALSRRCP